MAMLLGFVDSSGQTRTSTPEPTPESARETSLGNKVRPRTRWTTGAILGNNESVLGQECASYWGGAFLCASVCMDQNREGDGVKGRGAL